MHVYIYICCVCVCVCVCVTDRIDRARSDGHTDAAAERGTHTYAHTHTQISWTESEIGWTD